MYPSRTQISGHHETHRSSTDMEDDDCGISDLASTISRVSLDSPHSSSYNWEKGVSEEAVDRSIPNSHDPTAWDPDHVRLMQHISRRGSEPLLPQYYKFDYRFLPDKLFSPDNNAVLASSRGHHTRGIKALERLFELGAWVRDREDLAGRITPEEQIKRQLTAFIKWAEEDAGLDPRTAIPVVALEMKPPGTTAVQLQENARCKMERLAERYADAFRVEDSIETTPQSTRSSARLARPVPQIYCIIALGTTAALVAHRPQDRERPTPLVAQFDFKDKEYDAWSSLALAIIVCHARDVQRRIAEDTGVGQKRYCGEVMTMVDDPDR